MLTSSMPAVIKALSGYLPPAAVQQLTQAIGNCNQPLASRGGINAQPPAAFGLGTAGPGAIAGGAWRPQDYQGLLPTTDDVIDVVLPGYGGPGAWNLTNYSGDTFYFPTSQEFISNQYYGGPTFNVGGNTNFDNATAINITTGNLTTDYINGQPAPGRPGDIGPAGAPGQAGDEGPQGVAGRDGTDGSDGFDGFHGANGAPGRDGRNADLRGLARAKATLISKVTFDPTTCRLKVHTKEISYLVGGRAIQ